MATSPRHPGQRSPQTADFYPRFFEIKTHRQADREEHQQLPSRRLGWAGSGAKRDHPALSPRGRRQTSKSESRGHGARHGQRGQRLAGFIRPPRNAQRPERGKVLTPPRRAAGFHDSGCGQSAAPAPETGKESRLGDARRSARAGAPGEQHGRRRGASRGAAATSASPGRPRDPTRSRKLPRGAHS